MNITQCMIHWVMRLCCCVVADVLDLACHVEVLHSPAPLLPMFHTSQVSSKRVIDGIPMHVRHFLLRRFCKKLAGLPVQLHGQLASGPAGSTANDATSAGDQDSGSGSTIAGLLDVKQLMAEDQSTAARRAQLQHQRSQLHEVRLILSVY